MWNWTLNIICKVGGNDLAICVLFKFLNHVKAKTIDSFGFDNMEPQLNAGRDLAQVLSRSQQPRMMQLIQEALVRR